MLRLQFSKHSHQSVIFFPRIIYSKEIIRENICFYHRMCLTPKFQCSSQSLTYLSLNSITWWTPRFHPCTECSRTSLVKTQSCLKCEVKSIYGLHDPSSIILPSKSHVNKRRDNKSSSLPRSLSLKPKFLGALNCKPIF